MQMRVDLTVRQKQRLGMHFVLRQTVRVLEMPQQALCEWMITEVEKNPFLELMEMPRVAAIPQDMTRVPARQTLYEHIRAQIRENFSEEQERLVAMAYLERLDEKGYFRLAAQEEEVVNDKVLSVLHRFDPPGIFARNLQECLLLQLPKESIEYQLVKTCFSDLLRRRFAAIRKKKGIVVTPSLLKKLSLLATRPAERFGLGEGAPSLIVDLVFEKKGGAWTVSLREDFLPKVRMNAEYMDLQAGSAEENRQVRVWKNGAHLFFKALDNRKSFLLKIGTLLVKTQKAYFEQTGPLEPLSLCALAKHLGVHTSTASRALQGKFAETPCGILPLRALAPSYTKRTEAKHILQKLLAQEEKHRPMSDAEVSRTLQDCFGIVLARRTIAKYRRALHIQNSSMRKYCTKK